MTGPHQSAIVNGWAFTRIDSQQAADMLAKIGMAVSSEVCPRANLIGHVNGGSKLKDSSWICQELKSNSCFYFHAVPIAEKV